MDVREGMSGRRGGTRPALREAEPLDTTQAPTPSNPRRTPVSLAESPVLALVSLAESPCFICTLSKFARDGVGGLTRGRLTA